MPFMSGKLAFLELLKQEGVEIMFGNPGTTELPLMDAFATENDIRYVLGLQEAAVMAMADGYAQASGKLAVVNLHVAPGLGNAMGMLYDAQKAASPILVTRRPATSKASTPPSRSCGRTCRPSRGRWSKWSSEVHRLADLPLLVHRAAKTALAPPTGPVFLSLPGDILRAEGDIDLKGPTRIAPRTPRRPFGGGGGGSDPGAGQAPADHGGRCGGAEPRSCRTGGARRTHRRAGLYRVRAEHGVRFPRVASALSRCHGAPCARTCGRFSTSTTCCSRSAAICFTLSLPSDTDPMPPDITLIHLDVDPWELGKNYPPEVAILGDPKATLPELTELTRERMTSGARGGARDRLKTAIDATLAEREALKAKARSLATQVPIQPLALLEAIGDALPKDAVVIEEALSSAPGIRSLMRSDDPQSFYGLRGGGIGWGLPAAIGVKLALPDRPVVALIGDGSAMYTCQALWTRRARQDRRRVRHPQQLVVSHPQAAPQQHARPCGAGRHLCGDGADQSGGRFRQPCAARSASRRIGRRPCMRRRIC